MQCHASPGGNAIAFHEVPESGVPVDGAALRAALREKVSADRLSQRSAGNGQDAAGPVWLDWARRGGSPEGRFNDRRSGPGGSVTGTRAGRIHVVASQATSP